jgi:RNA polymerase sigma-70 factor, ECF subfamily
MITWPPGKLIARVPPGQERRLWLANLYESNYATVFRLCASILRDPEDAEDASQEVFLTAVDSLNPTVASGSATAWLLTVARNHCLDLLRRRKRFGKALVTLGSELSASTDVETAVADHDFIREVFSHLSSKERQVLWQSAVENRPLSDIAGRLRLSYMAAAQVAHRARLHASRVAARVAIILGLMGLGRVRRLGSLTSASRLAAAVAVPLMAVALHSSSSISPSVPPPVAGGSGGGHVSVTSKPVRSGAPGINRVLPTVNPTSLGQLLGSLPGTIVSSPAVPGLPSVAIPTAIPTLVPIPTPTGIP